MKKFIKIMFSVCLVFVSVVCVACEKRKVDIAEKITLAETVFGEVEFDNSEKVEIDMDNGKWVVSGEIEAMSAAQKSSFGVDDVTHIVVLKFEFDKERTIDYFEIDGNVTKVYSSNNSDKNYVGSISDLLDSESSENAYCYLILSANTKEYKFTVRYTDDVESVVNLKIVATLITATDSE